MQGIKPLEYKKGPMSNSGLKYFTPAEAVKTLPLVKKIVSDILGCGIKIRRIISSLDGNIEDNAGVQKLIVEMDSYIEELKEIGCLYKDWNFSIGLVDFPAIIEDKEVYLCWRSDEKEINYYHGINDGYAGRKIIPEHYFK